MLYRILTQLFKVEKNKMTASVVTHCLMKTAGIVIVGYAAGFMAEKGSAWMELIVVLLVTIVGSYMVYRGVSGILVTFEKISNFMSEVIETINPEEEG